MKKQFTLNMGMVTLDYVASNEIIAGFKTIMAVDSNLSSDQSGEDTLHQLSVLSAVPTEVREACTSEQPIINIYNGKDFKDGLIN